MFGFSDRGTKAVRGTKVFDVTAVVLQRVLTGERETGGTYTGDSKDFSVMMKPFQCGVECIKGGLSEHASACNVAEVEECGESLGDVGGYIAFECIYKNLVGLACKIVIVKCS
jgi:hypothetical protein